MKSAPATLVICLALLLAACTGRPAGVEPVGGFEVGRYLGTWYEVMRLDHRFERGLSHVTATYAQGADGTISVVNRGLERSSCQWRQASGVARFQGPGDVASLSVTFFWPFAGGYHVFALDRERYGWAIVSGPSHDYLWILSRTPELPAELRARLVEAARARAFPVDQLILVDHGPSGCPPP
jgi:apolipoprotein D and lipocalin family protein